MILATVLFAWYLAKWPIPHKVWSINGEGKTALVFHLSPVFDRTVLGPDFTTTNFLGFTRTVMSVSPKYTSKIWRLTILWLWIDFVMVRS